MKSLQIIFVFVFALCVASQRDQPPKVYPLNSFGSNGEQQYDDGRPITVPVEPKRSSNISSSTNMPSIQPPRYPPPPPPLPRQSQPLNSYNFSSNGGQDYKGKPISVSVERGSSSSQKDNPFISRSSSGRNDGRPSDRQSTSFGYSNAPSIGFETNLNGIPQVSQDENLNDFENSAQFKDSNLQGTQSSTFDPNDYSLNLNPGNNLCNNLRYFAFRTRTNDVATKRYLSVQYVCNSERLFFSNVLGQPKDNMLFIGHLFIDNTWVFESKVCPGYFIRATPNHIVDSTLGAFGSSKFWIKKFNFNHIIVQSYFYKFNYWTRQGTVYWTPFAFKYMVQYWPG